MDAYIRVGERMDLGFTTAASERETDGEIKEKGQQERGMDK